MESTTGNFLTNLPQRYDVELPEVNDFKVIRVVSYNIYSPIFGPLLPPALMQKNEEAIRQNPMLGHDPARTWDKRVQVIGQMMAKVRPHIVFFQELSPPQMKDLKIKLEPLGYEVVTCDSEGGKTLEQLETEKVEKTYLGLGIAFHKDRFVCVEASSVQLPHVDGYWTMWVKLEEKQLCRTLLAINAHFPFRATDLGHKNLQFCIDLAEQLSPEGPWIFGGDLNYFQKLEEKLENGTRFLNQAVKIQQSGVAHWTKTEQGHYGQPCTFIGFSEDPYQTLVTDEGVPEANCPDHLFHRGCDGALRSFSLAGEYDEEFTLLPLMSRLQSRNIASDHCLIGIDLVLNSILTNLPKRYGVNLPETKQNVVRVVSYNIFQCESNQHPVAGPWNKRREIIRQMMTEICPDIIYFQEMGRMQRVDLQAMMKDFEIVVADSAAPGLGIAFHKERFSLMLPPSSDGSQVMWVKLEEKRLKRSIQVLCAHFPLGSEGYRNLESYVQFAHHLSPEDPWIFGGDLNYFQEVEEQNQFGTLFLQAMVRTVQSGVTHWTKSRVGHYGQACTFLGFDKDAYKTPITAEGVPHSVCPDQLLHKGFTDALCSFSLSGEYDDENLELRMPLCNPLTDQKRYIASDHCLIGMDLVLEEKQSILQRWFGKK
jgi:endonuclease/exonuclease/phosphatase family metal-dependent hydrolase